MRVETVKADKLKPHPSNPRVHPESALKKLERSIRELGWTNPILVSADSYILAGHARLKAAKRLGLQEVPVIRLPLEGARAEAYMIADNRLAEETFWDLEGLEEMIERLASSGVDLEITGFSGEELEGLLQDFELDDLILEVNEPRGPKEKALTKCPSCGHEF